MQTASAGPESQMPPPVSSASGHVAAERLKAFFERLYSDRPTASKSATLFWLSAPASPSAECLDRHVTQ